MNEIFKILDNKRGFHIKLSDDLILSTIPRNKKCEIALLNFQGELITQYMYLNLFGIDIGDSVKYNVTLIEWIELLNKLKEVIKDGRY